MPNHSCSGDFVLRLGSHVLPPFVYACSLLNQSCHHTGPGVDIEVLRRILAPLRPCFHFIPILGSTGSTRDDVIAVMDDLRAGRYDLYAAALPIVSDILDRKRINNSLIPFSAPVDQDSVAFYVRAPVVDGIGNFLMLSVVDWRVLLLSFLIGVASFGTYLLSKKMDKRMFEDSIKKEENLRKTRLTGVGNDAACRNCRKTFSLHMKLKREPVAYMLPRLLTNDFGTTVYWIVMGVVLGVYSNLVSIWILKPQTGTPPFSTLEELAELVHSEKCFVVVSREAFSFFTEDVFPQNPQTELQERLFEAFSKNPPRVLASNIDVATVVLEEQYRNQCAIGVDFARLARIVTRQFCGLLAIVDPAIRQDVYAFALNPRMPPARLARIRFAFSSGAPPDLYLRIFSSYASRMVNTSCPSDDGGEVRPLSVGQVSDSFATLVVGTLLAIFALWREFVKWKRAQMAKARRRRYLWRMSMIRVVLTKSIEA